MSLVNGPDIKTQGIDFKAEYTRTSTAGTWMFGIVGTRTLTWDLSEWQFGAAHDAVGRLNYDTSLARSLVKWKGGGHVNLRRGGFNARWSIHYTGAYKHDLDSEPRISAQMTHDLVVSFTHGDERLTLEAAVVNAADDKPPRVYRQINYDPVTHNPLGRIWQIGATWRP